MQAMQCYSWFIALRNSSQVRKTPCACLKTRWTRLRCVVILWNRSFQTTADPLTAAEPAAKLTVSSIHIALMETWQLGDIRLVLRRLPMYVWQDRRQGASVVKSVRICSSSSSRAEATSARETYNGLFNVADLQRSLRCDRYNQSITFLAAFVCVWTAHYKQLGYDGSVNQDFAYIALLTFTVRPGACMQSVHNIKIRAFPCYYWFCGAARHYWRTCAVTVAFVCAHNRVIRPSIRP